MAAEPQKYPGVVSATVQARGSDTFDFDVTVSSPYDTPGIKGAWLNYVLTSAPSQ